MRDSLSIRAYTPDVVSHDHAFHQVVVPLCGVMDMSMQGTSSSVAVGQCVTIPRHTTHTFHAGADARFLVADLTELSNVDRLSERPFAQVSQAFRTFCVFADLQLSSTRDEALESSMIPVFKNLLLQQDFLPTIDPRISRVLAYIESDIRNVHTLNKLAAIATLSVSQFKVLFARHTQKTVGQYVLMVRMDKARALLINTDMPIQIIADNIGYQDASAFARRFQSYYGLTPSQYAKRHQS